MHMEYRLLIINYKKMPGDIDKKTTVHFYDLDVWKKAHSMSLEIYKVTENFPKKELYGIIDQVRRSASSVGANIAEGCGRFHYKEKIKFYYNARGSAYEVQNFIFLSQDLGYIDRRKARGMFLEYEDLIKQINSIVGSINKRIIDNK